MYTHTFILVLVGALNRATNLPNKNDVDIPRYTICGCFFVFSIGKALPKHCIDSHNIRENIANSELRFCA